MQEFIKKNIEVQAVQYDGMPESLEELNNLGLQYKLGEDSSITIITSRGEVTGEIGDYILLSITGEFEICNRDKFLKLYSEKKDEEPVQSVSQSEIKPEEPVQKEDEIISEPSKKNNFSFFPNLNFITACIELIMIVLLPLIMNFVVKNSIKTTVENIYQEEIQEESNKLLNQTKIEAKALIDQAKKDAVLEADEAFKKEMERLTNERVKK